MQRENLVKKKSHNCECFPIFGPLTGHHLSNVAFKLQVLTPSGFRQSEWLQSEWGEGFSLCFISGSEGPLAAPGVGYPTPFFFFSYSLPINSLVPLQMPLLFLSGSMLLKRCQMFVGPEILRISTLGE